MDKSALILCIYEDGVFKPLEKVDLKDGTKVQIKVVELYK
jgi:predicted DNA-binding antitoxin AbrB/MazE fold protein